MAIRYQLTEAEFVSAQRTLLGRRLRSRLLPLAAGMLMVAGGLYLYGRQLSALTFVVLLAALLGGLWLVLPWTWRRMYRGIPQANRENSVEFSDDGLVYESAMAHGSVRWGLYSHYVETDQLILLYQPTRVIVPLPKRAFPPDELRRFQQLLAEHLPRDRPPRRPKVAAAQP